MMLRERFNPKRPRRALMGRSERRQTGLGWMPGWGTAWVVGIGLTGMGETTRADVTGYAPPLYFGVGTPLEKTGVQRTYLFYKDGIETLVIQPAFASRVGEFGLLVPFPTAPSVHQLPHDVFHHVAAAVDPPEIVIQVQTKREQGEPPADVETERSFDAAQTLEAASALPPPEPDVYDVTVFQPSDLDALHEWMNRSGLVYPEGMEAAVETYLQAGWNLAAVRVKVESRKRDAPASSDGPLYQGLLEPLVFRFHADQPVIPTGLSNFGPGEWRDVLYILTDHPCQVTGAPEEMTVRQIDGARLRRHFIDPLPLRLLGGDYADVKKWRRQSLERERRADLHTRLAMELFACDLAAAAEDRLIHPHEALKRTFLKIAVALNLAPSKMEPLHDEVLRDDRRGAMERGLPALEGMTLTVIDGRLPRGAASDMYLTLGAYALDDARNRPTAYHARWMGPAPDPGGTVETGWPAEPTGEKTASSKRARLARSAWGGWLWVFLPSVVAVGIAWIVRRVQKKKAALPPASIAWIGVAAWTSASLAPQDAPPSPAEWIERLEDPVAVDPALDALTALGDDAIPSLLNEAARGESWVKRGWSIVALKRIGGSLVAQGLTEIYEAKDTPNLVRAWAGAARLQVAESLESLLEWAEMMEEFPALIDPVRLEMGKRIVDPGSKPPVNLLLDRLNRTPELQEVLEPMVSALGPTPLTRSMMEAQNPSTRAAAARLLSGLARHEGAAVARMVIQAYRFDPQASEVPWGEGPPVIPELDWTAQEARALAGQLLRWYVRCDQIGDAGNFRRIHETLCNVALERAAGYRAPGPTNRRAAQPATVENWLLTWGQIMGGADVEAILAEQNLPLDGRFKEVLERLFKGK